MVISFLRNLRDRLGNLRVFERQASNETARISVFKATGDATSFEARCRDASCVGLGIVSPMALAPGKVVLVDFRDKVQYAQVRRCSPLAQAHQVGLQFVSKP